MEINEIPMYYNVQNSICHGLLHWEHEIQCVILYKHTFSVVYRARTRHATWKTHALKTHPLKTHPRHLPKTHPLKPIRLKPIRDTSLKPIR